jgi:GNAT superfamily N-acetyltransferase
MKRTHLAAESARARAELRVRPWHPGGHAGLVMPNDDRWVVDADVDRVDWTQAKADLVSDSFDNGRSPDALRRSFEQSPHTAFAWLDGRLVGMARMLSDGVCNAYLVDVWTHSSVRRLGIATAMVSRLKEEVPGQHIGLQTGDAEHFYAGLGFRRQPHFLSLVVGHWLDNDANR